MTALLGAAAAGCTGPNASFKPRLPPSDGPVDGLVADGLVADLPVDQPATPLDGPLPEQDGPLSPPYPDAQPPPVDAALPPDTAAPGDLAEDASGADDALYPEDALALPEAATAADRAPGCPAPVVGTGTGLAAEYFDNPDFTGTRVTRLDPTVNFGFPQAPAPGIGADTFSARWTGKLQAAESGPHALRVSYNDGVRLFIDDRVALYRWGTHATKEESVSMTLVAGQKYDLRLELYDETGSATARLSWENACQPRQIIPASQLYPEPPTTRACPSRSAPASGTGLLGEYFADQTLTSVRERRLDPQLDFLWPAAPAPTVAADQFSVRWTGTLLSPVTGPLTIYFLADDTGRVYIDGVLSMDGWSEPYPPQEIAATIDVTAGQRLDLRIEMRDSVGNAAARLFWSWPCQPRERVPTSQLFPPIAP